jgi:pimeloyl-ACP methyl ester carboxylesterase
MRLRLRFSHRTLRKADAASLLKQIRGDMDPVSALNVLLRDFDLGGTNDSSERLKEISVPTPIVHGADDMIPVSLANYLHENIRRSKLEIIADAGNMVMMKKPDEFNKAILKFVLSE